MPRHGRALRAPGGEKAGAVPPIAIEAPDLDRSPPHHPRLRRFESERRNHPSTVASNDFATKSKPLSQSSKVGPLCVPSLAGQNADPSHELALLRPRRERPRSRRAADKRDEFASPDHSMTSLALSKIDEGTVRPSALAVLRFTIISNFVGTCTGRSPGFSPRRMRST